MVRAYYSNANGAFVVFDITDENSFSGAADWKKDIDNKLAKKIPVVLLANKIDLLPEAERQRIRLEVEEFSKYAFFLPLLTSASGVTNS